MAAAWLPCPNYPKLALQLLPGREVPPTSCRPCVLIYTDAACEPNMLVGMAVVAFCQTWPKPKAGFLNVPREWLDFLLPRQTQINQAECLAVVLTINNIRPLLERADMWRFIGNLPRIVPKKMYIASISAVVHLFYARAGSQPYFEHVHSKANINYAMSREGWAALQPDCQPAPVSLLPRLERSLMLYLLLILFGTWAPACASHGCFAALRIFRIGPALGGKTICV